MEINGDKWRRAVQMRQDARLLPVVINVSDGGVFSAYR